MQIKCHVATRGTFLPVCTDGDTTCLMPGSSVPGLLTWGSRLVAGFTDRAY